MESRTLAPVLSYILSKMVERNDKIPLIDMKRTVFHAQKSPLISLNRYLERVLSFAPCSNSCFIVALIYIDRIIQTNHDFILNSLSVHRMLITSVMVATKFFDDETYNNLYYAKVGGLPVSELNQLEHNFFQLIHFSLSIKTDVYDRYHSELLKHVSGSTCPKASVTPLRSKLSQELPAPPKSNTLPLSRSTSALSSMCPVSVPTEKDPTVKTLKQEETKEYQSGFDYAARDMIPTTSKEEATPLNFGNLTVGGISVNYPSCTPSYSNNHQPQMVALSRG